jgi:hypothetical protein
MQVKYGILALAAFALTGCAASQQADQTNAQLTVMHTDLTNISTQLNAIQNQPKPKPGAARACYLAGQPYSEGAVVAGRVCTELGGIYMNGERADLGWQAQRTK